MVYRLALSRLFYSSLCCAFVCLNSGRVSADTLVFGVPEFEAGTNVLTDSNPLALLTRSATLRGLTIRSGAKGFSLGLADTVETSADFGRWSFRLSRVARFSSGKPITTNDVLYSIQRCRSLGQLNQIGAAEIRKEDWVDLLLKAGGTIEERAAAFPIALASCPIFDQEVSKLFGPHLGLGTNLVTAGPYEIVDFQTAKQLTLQRLNFQAAGQRGATTVEIRGFRDPGHGLTALRSGTVDVLFTEHAETLSRAEKDVTLSVGRCDSYTVVRRKVLEFSCEPTLDMSRVRYAG